MIRLFALICTICTVLALPVKAAPLSYNLVPQKIADQVYALIGSTEHFSRRNGGNIVNTGFIIGPHGVIVIDTGPSSIYGREMRTAIRKITPKPVTHVIITHHHPDHFLGNQAFDGATFHALPETIEGIHSEGNGLLENMFRMVGDWMIDTQVVIPQNPVAVSAATLSGRALRFVPLHGHTAGDLAILDEESGVLFTGDIAFYNRTPTTPHANIDDWLIALETLETIPFKTIVPGHGPVERDGASLAQTKDYLNWLKTAFSKAAHEGLEMMEVMHMDKPERFKALSVDRIEFQRSVSHLWPTLVETTLPRVENETE